MYIQSLSSAIDSLRTAGMRIRDIARYDKVPSGTVSSWSSGRSQAGGVCVEAKLYNSAKTLADYTRVLQDIAANRERPVERVRILYTNSTPEWALSVTTAIATAMLHSHASTPDQMILPVLIMAYPGYPYAEDGYAVVTRTVHSIDYVDIYPNTILHHVQSVMPDNDIELTQYPKEVR